MSHVFCFYFYKGFLISNNIRPSIRGNTRLVHGLHIKVHAVVDQADCCILSPLTHGEGFCASLLCCLCGLCHRVNCLHTLWPQRFDIIYSALKLSPTCTLGIPAASS